MCGFVNLSRFFAVWFGIITMLSISTVSVSANEKPEIFVQLGHSSSINAAAFSSDGRYIVSGSADNTVKLWEASTGREIRTFTGHTKSVYSVALSPDDRYALSGSADETIKLWDIQTGKEIRAFTGNTTFTGYRGDVYSVAFSPDGKYVASGRDDRTVRLWETSSGREIRTLTGHTGLVKSIAFSPDGRYIVSGSADNTVKLWEASTGREIRTFTGHTKGVYSVALSPDDRYALSGSADETIKLWDIQTGKEIRAFKGHTGDVYSVAFSTDGRYITSGSEDNTVRLWETSSGRQIRALAHRQRINSVVFSPDGRYIVSGSDDNTVKLWEASTGREMRNIKGHTGRVNSVAFSPDGTYLVSSDGKIRFWDISSGQLTHDIRKQYGRINFANFSSDGRYLATKAGKAIILWDVSTGKDIRALTGHTDSVTSAAFSPDGRHVVSRSKDNTVRLWEVSTGKEIRTFTGYADWGSPVAFSPDGRNIVTGGSGDEPVRLWEASTGKEIRTFTGYANWVSSVAFSPDGRYIVAGGTWDKTKKDRLRERLLWMLHLRETPPGDSDNAIRLWEASSGRKIKTFKGHTDHVNAVAFSPDGKYIASGSQDHTARLWDTSAGREIRTLAGHTGWVVSVAFSHNSKHVVSGSYDGTTRLWDIATGKEIAQFISFKDGEWIVITPEGYYNSSANGDKYLNVRVGNNVYGIDQYRATFYKPRIVEAALRGVNIEEAVARVTGDQKKALSPVYTEPPFIVIKSPEDGKKIASTDTEISLYIEDRNQTIKKVKVFVNGRVATGGEGRGIKIIGAMPEGKKSMELKVPVHLDIGENLIEVTAFNGFSEGRKSIRIYSSVEKGKGRVILPNLWILSIGINRYQDKKLPSLSYAASDAEGIVKAFSGQKGKLFREINTLVINDHSRIKPTYENIVDNLSYLSRAGNNDVTMLFIAGHGMNNDRGEFYFLPSDAVITEDGTIKRSRAISWREIKSILDIPAKKLLFADTCHSEGVSGKKTRGVDSDRFVKELQEANAVIFTSSRGRELSQESDRWKHGAFTYALIEGIKGKADLIKDNKISMKELDAYVSETVPKITSGAQHPITNTPDGYVNFPVAIVK